MMVPTNLNNPKELKKYSQIIRCKKLYKFFLKITIVGKYTSVYWLGSLKIKSGKGGEFWKRSLKTPCWQQWNINLNNINWKVNSRPSKLHCRPTKFWLSTLRNLQLRFLREKINVKFKTADKPVRSYYKINDNIVALTCTLVIGSESTLR